MQSIIDDAGYHPTSKESEPQKKYQSSIYFDQLVRETPHQESPKNQIDYEQQQLPFGQPAKPVTSNYLYGIDQSGESYYPSVHRFLAIEGANHYAT